MCGFCGFIDFEKKDNEELNILILKKIIIYKIFKIVY